MRLTEALLDVPEHPSDLDSRAADILDRLCAAAYATELPTDVSFDEIDALAEKMTVIDQEGSKVASVAAKARSIAPARSAQQFFI
jgi:hypothetical protein